MALLPLSQLAQTGGNYEHGQHWGYPQHLSYPLHHYSYTWMGGGLNVLVP